MFPVELDHIREVAVRFNARLSEGDVLLNVAAILAEGFNAPAVGDRHRRGRSAQPPDRSRIPAGRGIQRRVDGSRDWLSSGGMSVLRNRVCVTGDVDSDPLLSLEQRAWLRENDVRAVWSVPLPAKSGEPAGAAVLMYAAPHRPDTNTVLMCQVYCQHAAMALDNARPYDALRTQAIHDSKTALFTHDYLLEAIRAELSRAARSGQPTALLMLDIGDYKSFNDTYGHVAGDHVLAELASIIRDQVSDSDTPARFGGEEFSVLLPGTSAVEAAERIRAAIGAYPISVKAGETARVTISIGVAVHEGPSANPDLVIEASDAALYDSKRSGKNTVRIAP